MIILEAAILFALNYAYTIQQEIWLSEDNIGIKKTENISFIRFRNNLSKYLHQTNRCTQ